MERKVNEVVPADFVNSASEWNLRFTNNLAQICHEASAVNSHNQPVLASNEASECPPKTASEHQADRPNEPIAGTLPRELLWLLEHWNLLSPMPC